MEDVCGGATSVNFWPTLKRPPTTLTLYTEPRPGQAVASTSTSLSHIVAGMSQANGLWVGCCGTKLDKAALERAHAMNVAMYLDEDTDDENADDFLRQPNPLTLFVEKWHAAASTTASPLRLNLATAAYPNFQYISSLSASADGRFMAAIGCAPTRSESHQAVCLVWDLATAAATSAAGGLPPQQIIKPNATFQHAWQALCPPYTRGDEDDYSVNGECLWALDKNVLFVKFEKTNPTGYTHFTWLLRFAAAAEGQLRCTHETKLSLNATTESKMFLHQSMDTLCVTPYGSNEIQNESLFRDVANQPERLYVSTDNLELQAKQPMRTVLGEATRGTYQNLFISTFWSQLRFGTTQDFPRTRGGPALKDQNGQPVRLKDYLGMSPSGRFLAFDGAEGNEPTAKLVLVDLQGKAAM